MAAISYPLLNGARPSFADMELVLGGTVTPIPFPITGFSSFDYSDEFDGVIVHGATQTPIGQTNGQYSAKGSCTMYKTEFAALVQAVGFGGVGYMTQYFDILLSYSLGPTLPIVYDQLKGCRIKSVSESHKTGGEALMVSFDLSPLIIVRNGVYPTSDYQQLLQLSLQLKAGAL